MIYAIIWLMLIAMGLGITLIKHGEPKKEKYNFWVQLIASSIEILLLWGAGIFENFK